MSLLTALCNLMQERGFNVCVIERNELQGRTQEWNISRHELQVGLDSAIQIDMAQGSNAASKNQYSKQVDPLS